MLHYHQNGVTLTLEFSSAAEISYFQEGLTEMLNQLSESADQYPVQGVSLHALAQLMRATMLTEQQTLNMSKGLQKIGKLPESGPIDSQKAA